MSNITPYVQREIITKDKVQLVKDMIMKGASDSELELFVSNCNRTGLDPMQKQCWAVKRWDSSLQREVFSFQTGVDGFRIVANRSGKYSGQLGPYWCGEDGEWKDVWLSDKPPIAAKVGVLKEDFKEPLWAVAKFSSYAARKKDGSLTPFWLKMPDLMIAKVAECLALRKAFPQDLSGVYSSEEMEQAEDAKDVTPKVSAATMTAAKIEVDQKNKSKLNSAIPLEEVEHMGREKEHSHIVYVKPPVENHADKVNPSKEQCEALRQLGFKHGWTMEEMCKLIYDKFKIRLWTDMKQPQFSEIWAIIAETKKSKV